MPARIGDRLGTSKHEDPDHGHSDRLRPEQRRHHGAGNAYSFQVRITTRLERPLAGYSPATQQVAFEGRVRLRNK